MSDAAAVGLWAAGYAAIPVGLFLFVLAFLRFLRFLTPEGGEDMATDAAERAAEGAVGDAAGDGRGPKSFRVVEDDGDPEVDVPAVADIPPIPSDFAPSGASTPWRRGDLVSFDNGKTRFERVRLVGPYSRRPGVWVTDIVGVDLHEVYFRKAD